MRGEVAPSGTQTPFSLRSDHGRTRTKKTEMEQVLDILKFNRTEIANNFVHFCINPLPETPLKIGPVRADPKGAKFERQDKIFKHISTVHNDLIRIATPMLYNKLKILDHNSQN